MSARWMPLLVIVFAACGPSVETTPGTECTGDAQCDDGNLCTADACAEGRCAHTALPDGPALEAPGMTGDCVKAMCASGALTYTPDDADVQDDGNPCTVDACSSGTPQHVPVPAGTPCSDGFGPGVCDAMGSCNAGDCNVDCGAPGPCADVGCDPQTGQCLFTPKPAGTPCPEGTCDGLGACI